MSDMSHNRLRRVIIEATNKKLNKPLNAEQIGKIVISQESLYSALMKIKKRHRLKTLPARLFTRIKNSIFKS